MYPLLVVHEKLVSERQGQRRTQNDDIVWSRKERDDEGSCVVERMENVGVSYPVGFLPRVQLADAIRRNAEREGFGLVLLNIPAPEHLIRRRDTAREAHELWR